MYRLMCLFVCVVFVLLVFDAVTPQTQAVASVPGTAAAPSALAPESIEEQVFQAINRIREEKHLVPLSAAKDLSHVARAHSQDMAVRGYFSHVSPDGADLRGRIIRNGITNWQRLAENIAMNLGHQNPAEVAVKGWLKSSPHLQNILDARLTETGIGVAVDKTGRIYLTQLFATRK